MFETKKITDIYKRLIPSLNDVLIKLNKFDYDLGAIDRIVNEIRKEKIKNKDEQEEIINDLFKLNAFISLIKKYILTITYIEDENFENSWFELQNTFDYLRILKKYSFNLEIKLLDKLENQLIEIEELFPYKIFVSPAVTVDFFECTVCGKDIDSFDCGHIRGELYRGVMAAGIAQNIIEVHGLDWVPNPYDKRSVTIYPKDSELFFKIRAFSNYLKSKKIPPLAFIKVKILNKKIFNDSYIKLNRNDLCFCNSGIKFKRCCIDKKYIEKNDVQFYFDIQFKNDQIKKYIEI